MNEINPINQTKLYGLKKYIDELIKLQNNAKLPTKILLSGLKGTGKSTLAYHFVNYVLSKTEDFNYNIDKCEINTQNHSFITIKNKSNPNLIILDINDEKKFIDIDQVRKLIITLNKSSFNSKPRFVVIDNIEFLNVNSINALLKILEEPTSNTYFILINNSNGKILPTLYSRCINFKITLSNNESLMIANQLLDGRLNQIMNSDLINYYSTPGNILRLIKFGETNNYDLLNMDLKKFLTNIIKDKQYKDILMLYLIFDLIESYFRKLNQNINTQISNRYDYFMKRISDIKKFNLDTESLFIELKEEILNG